MSKSANSMAQAMRQIRVFAGERVDDSELLTRFQLNRDQAAFAEIVRRHGPLVLGVARRWLADRHEADDIVQATFLALSRQAKRLDRLQPLGGWLYTVAFRHARKAQIQSSRRRAQVVALCDAAAPDPLAEITGRELLQALDVELACLPERYRLPLLACGLEGLTRDEAAERLGYSPGTLKGRLERGREMLRNRLEARGLALPIALAGVLVAESSVALSAQFIGAITQAALAAPAFGAGMKIAAVVGVLLIALGAGAGLALRPDEKGKEPVNKPPVAYAPGFPNDEMLPEGAIARIGSTLLRQVSWHKRVFFTADGKSLIVTDNGNKVHFWDIATGRKTSELEVPHGHFRDADFAPATGTIAVIGQLWPKEGLTATSQIKEAVWLIDTVNQKVLHTILPDLFRGANHKIRLMRDGKRAVSHIEGDLRVWDVNTGADLKQLSLKREIRTTTLAVSPDGKTIAFGRYDVYCWNWETEAEPRKLTTIGNAGTELIQFGPDGRLYVAPREGGALKVFETESRRQVGFVNTVGVVVSLAFSPDGKSLAAGYRVSMRGIPLEKTVAIFELKTGAERKRFPVDSSAVESVNWSADGTRLAAGSSNRLWAWDAATGQSLSPEPAGHAEPINALAFGLDGHLFTASDDHTIRSWDAASGKHGVILQMNDWVRGLAISPNGKLLAGSAFQNDLRVWELRSGQVLFRMLGNGKLGSQRRVRFTNDGQRLVAFGDDETLRVFEMRNGKLISETRLGPEEPDLDGPEADKIRELQMFSSHSALSPDGSAIALSSRSTIRVLDTMTAKETASLNVRYSSTLRMAFSTSGKHLAITGAAQENRKPGEVQDPHRVEVWNLAKQTRVWEGTVPGQFSYALAFSTDDSTLAATSPAGPQGGALRFWDAETGRPFGAIDTPGPAWELVFDRTGKRIAIALRDTSAIVYDLQSVLKLVPPH